MRSVVNVVRRSLEDIRGGRNREAYALFLIGLLLVALGLAGVIKDQILLSAMLLALTFLVFHTSLDKPSGRFSLDDVLQTRDSFGPFSKLLPGVRDLRIYGPTAVNILVSSGDIRRFVLNAGGTIRVIIQDDKPEMVAQTALQLDDNLDLTRTLHGSMGVLERLAEEPRFEYRRLPFNPGFSLVVVNAESPNGYVIFESHGFMDENIADRMHIVIRKQESPHWFGYWVSRFEAMWNTALVPAGKEKSLPSRAEHPLVTVHGMLVNDGGPAGTGCTESLWVSPWPRGRRGSCPGLLTWRLADGVCLGLGLGSGLDLLPVFSAFSGVSRGPGGAGF
jgi:hypothetical protein